MGISLSRSHPELERLKQQVAMEQTIGKKRIQLSKNMPGKSNDFPKGVNVPNRLLISLFGETGAGKSSLINSLRYAIAGELTNQHIVQSANPNHQGAHSMESLEVVLTHHLSVIDNPGINCEKALDTNTQKDAIRHMEGRYQKGTVTWKSIPPGHENEEDKKSYCSVMVFSANNVNVAREYRGFIHCLREWQGRFPPAVITHVDKDSPTDVRLALETAGIGDIYEVANITCGGNGRDNLSQEHQVQLLNLLENCFTAGDSILLRRQEIESGK